MSKYMPKFYLPRQLEDLGSDLKGATFNKSNMPGIAKMVQKIKKFSQPMNSTI